MKLEDSKETHVDMERICTQTVTVLSIELFRNLGLLLFLTDFTVDKVAKSSEGKKATVPSCCLVVICFHWVKWKTHIWGKKNSQMGGVKPIWPLLPSPLLLQSFPYRQGCIRVCKINSRKRSGYWSCHWRNNSEWAGSHEWVSRREI